MQRRALSIIVGLAASIGFAAPPPARLSFNRDIRPILSANCYQCHGQDAHARKASLRLDGEAFVFAPRKDGPVMVRGDPDHSPLVRRVESTDESEIMPAPESHKTLTSDEKAKIRRWVSEGAEFQPHWAFISPTRPVVPPFSNSKFQIRNPIDAFIGARLAAENLHPAPEADRFALLRRVTFDLTGLPPTPEEVAAFVADRSPEAYERAVDRLLASPRYGEHRARYWLDAARYSDTNGPQFDNVRLSWPFRDYVIRAFNENKPFDQFATEQIAGDLLPAETFEQLMATGFNRAHLTTNEDGSVPEENQHLIVTDRVQTVASIFLGLTATCASCHDHKFDPLTQREFYQLAAFFNNTTDHPYDGNQPSAFPTLALPPPENRAAADALLRERAAVECRLRDRNSRAPELTARWLESGGASQLSSVANDGLVARFRFDEGAGTRVRNSAPGATPAHYETEGQEIAWGEQVHLWPMARFEGRTRFRAGQLGAFERTDPFTVAGWFKPRVARMGFRGALISKMAEGEPGWEFYWQDAGTQPAHLREGRLLVNLVGDSGDHAISVRTRALVGRMEWSHLAFVYDGSGQAAGVRIFVNGEPQETEVLKDALAGSIRTTAPLEFARAPANVVEHRSSPSMSETAFQDCRVYARRLTDREVRATLREDYTAEILQRAPAGWNEDERAVVTHFYFRHFDPEMMALHAHRARLEHELERLTTGGVKALVTVEREGAPFAFVFARGLYTDRRERVRPDVPAFLPPLPADARRDRLGLARWLFSPGHPLTARVTVNRMWQEIFGTGLVETAGDFGVVGAPPSHPELLDWLAVDFQESAWNVKRFYRQLVCSATYRQRAAASPALIERDPENRLLARGPRFRLDAESIRDSALAAGGLLVERPGGPSVRSYQPAGVWEPASRIESNTFVYKQDAGDALYRRSLYSFWKRTSAPPVMTTFDAPMREVCVVSRERTNTPLQALVLLNETTFVEAARHLATRTLHRTPANDADRLAHLCAWVLSGPPSARQQVTLLNSLARFRAGFPDAAQARTFLTVGESPVDATLPPVELAAWTLVASLLMNSDAALNK